MAARYLIVVADDYGMGPEVSRGIRELMQIGSVTGTVLMVNSPHAEDDVRKWHRQGIPGDLGWHPCLTMDAPTAPIGQVSSIVSPDGKLLPLGSWMTGLALGTIRYGDVVRELMAQYLRCCELIGRPPFVINGHKHIHVFPLVSQALTEVLQRQQVKPYVRQVRESWGCLRSIPGARLKRGFLTTLGRWAGRRQKRSGFATNESLAGITDPIWVEDPEFHARWLAKVPGKIVEFAVHPGYHDETLLGRDCTRTDGQLQRRVTELQMLREPGFRDACRAAGFTWITASELFQPEVRRFRHAA